MRESAGRLRQWVMGVLVLGLAGTGIELVLFGHYEDMWQRVPLALIGVSFGVLVWHAVRRDTKSVWAIRATMASILLAGVVGVALHARGAAEFQREIDPTQSWWDLSKKVMQAQSPPVLAPGVMVQLGLLGLAYAYRYPD